MIQHNDYGVAHKQLLQILSKKDYGQVASQNPWYARVLSWLANHIFNHLTPGGLFHAGRAVTIGVAVILVAAIVWTIRNTRRNASLRTIRDVRRTVAMDNKILLAERAKESGEFALMLHYLTEASLEAADVYGWVRALPHKTARSYLRELKRKGTEEFHHMFEALTVRAEQVLFAGKPMYKEEAGDLFKRVQMMLAVSQE